MKDHIMIHYHIGSEITELINFLIQENEQFKSKIENIYNESEEELDFYLTNHLLYVDESIDYEEYAPIDEKIELAYKLGFQPALHEVKQWFVVSEILYNQMKISKYPVIDFNGIYVWGRTSDNKYIWMDEIIKDLFLYPKIK